MELESAIAEFVEQKNGLDSYTIKIFRKFEDAEISDAIKSMLDGKKIRDYEAALAFVVYLVNNDRSLFGKQEIPLVMELKQGDRLQEFFLGIIGQANFCKLLPLLLNLGHLPISKDEQDVDAYFDSILKSQPLLLKYLINYLIQINGNFPRESYDRIQLSDKLLEFYAKYECIGSWLVEPFMKVQLYRDLLPITPEVYAQDLKDKIEYFQNFVGDGDSELQVDNSLEEPVSPLDSLLAGYYDYCLEKSEKGESHDFELYLQYR